jgi:hypothetical protein
LLFPCFSRLSVCSPSMGMRTKERTMRHHDLLPRKFRWHKYGTPEVRVDSRKVGPFIQAIVSLLSRSDPPFRRVNLFRRWLWHAPAIAALAEYRLDRLSSGDQTGRVCRKSAAVIASKSCWQRDQHGCNRRKQVRMKC